MGEQFCEVVKIHVAVNNNMPLRHDFCRAKQTSIRVCKATFNHRWSQYFRNQKYWSKPFWTRASSDDSAQHESLESTCNPHSSSKTHCKSCANHLTALIAKRAFERLTQLLYLLFVPSENVPSEKALESPYPSTRPLPSSLTAKYVLPFAPISGVP